MTRTNACLYLLVFLLMGCSRPYNIKPIPSFIQHSIDAGDTIILAHKTQPEPTKVKVVAVEKEALVLETGSIAFTQILSITKISATKPDYPCGGEESLGCSIPFLLRVTDGGYGKYAHHFFDSCVQHDFCYRHGFRTYGYGQYECDLEFRENLLFQCTQKDQRSWTQQILNNDTHAGSCEDIAQQMFQALQIFGAANFKKEDSTFCAYNG